MNLSMLSGPIIGAIIGYGTNWIAIKMLFRPRKAVKIGRFTLPFTPGIIPKRKDELAKAVGDMVGNNLFTQEDMKNMLLSEEIENIIVDNIMNIFESENSFKELFLSIIDEEHYAHGRENIKLLISEKIRDGLLKAEIGDLIATEGKKAIQMKVKGMLKMFVNDDLINSIVQPMGGEVEKFIKEHSQEKIVPIVEDEISEIENKSISKLMSNFEINYDEMKNIIKSTYTNVVVNYISTVLERLDISKVVENKIKDMEVVELEKLILKVMKRELGAIVNLGALIGLVLGTLNIVL